MTFPHILYSTDYSLHVAVGMLVALILGYFEKSLTLVAIASVVAVYLCNVLL